MRHGHESERLLWIALWYGFEYVCLACELNIGFAIAEIDASEFTCFFPGLRGLLQVRGDFMLSNVVGPVRGC